MEEVKAKDETAVKQALNQGDYTLRAEAAPKELTIFKASADSPNQTDSIWMDASGSITWLKSEKGDSRRFAAEKFPLSLFFYAVAAGKDPVFDSAHEKEKLTGVLFAVLGELLGCQTVEFMI